MIPGMVEPEPTVTFDADVLGRRRGGEETMVRGLLDGLATLDLPFRVLAYMRDPAAFPARGRVQPVALPVSSNYARVAVALPRQLARDRPALHHGNYVLPPRLPCPAVLTISDCSWARLGESMPVADRVAFRRFVPWSARRAAHITTISEHARTDLLDLFGWLDPARVTVLPLAVDVRFVPVPPDPARFGLPESYVVCLGAVQPRKNLARLLEAWATVQARGEGGDAVLAIAGRPKQEAGAYAALADRLGIADTVRWLGYVADDDLPVLLAGARCLVFPSLYEGFGLPVVEAMAVGCPVITSDTTSLPETAAGAALLVDPLSPTAIASAIARLLSDEPERARLRELGLARAAKLSWTRSAEVLAGVYTDVMSATATR
jgi:glycosyltransferase involved in cell wall biosynthesis